MKPTKSKSAARIERRSKRPRNDEALLFRLKSAEDATRKQPIKARETQVAPLNDAQRRYDAAIRSTDIIFGIGPAGTGKTWFAVQRAAEALKAKLIDKIVLTRPAVEVGAGMGFLPGEIEDKYEPYIRPLRDAFDEAFGSTHTDYLLKTGIIDARPLAYLRGSTLKRAWVIADEMQNATVPEFKMFLSRIGENAKFLVNGDPRQSDIANSGLEDAVRRLKGIDEVSVVEFTNADIVRSGLCAKVVAAYDTPTVARYNAMNDSKQCGCDERDESDGERGGETVAA